MPTDNNQSPKYEVRGSVSLDVINDLTELLDREKKKSREEGRSTPDKSAILEMVLRKGLKELLRSTS